MDDAIRGVDGMTIDDLRSALRRGGRCVRYQFVVSGILLSRRRSSGIYFIPVGASAVTPGLLWSLITVLFGWWGFPGPVFTIPALVKNFQGGDDVTGKVMAALRWGPDDVDGG